MALLTAVPIVISLVISGCASTAPVVPSAGTSGEMSGEMSREMSREMSIVQPLPDPVPDPTAGRLMAMPELHDRMSTDDAKRAAARRIVERARAAFRDGRHGDTADLLERAVAIDGGFAESYMLLAFLHLKKGSHDVALAFLDKAQQLAAVQRESLAEIESLRGTVLEELGRREAARHAYERALALSPENVRARAGLARMSAN